MAIRIFPTVNDVGGGKTISEPNLATLLAMFCALPGFVVSGLGISAGAGLNLSIASGSAMIRGYLVTVDALSVALAANQANLFVYLQLSRDSSQNVTGVQIVTNTTWTVPADAILLGKAVTGASSILSVDHYSQWQAPGLTLANNNEFNFAHNYAGGEVHLNYRGVRGAITGVRFDDGMGTGALVQVTASAFRNGSGLPAAISGAPAASGSAAVADGNAITFNHNLGRIPLIMISSSAGNVQMVLQLVNSTSFTVYNNNSGGNTNSFTWYAY